MQDLSWLERSTQLIGKDRLEILLHAHVLIVGLGGVGSFAAEFICRSGVGKMTIVDGDIIERSNRNRQLPALASNEGQGKAAVMAARLLAINPALQLKVIHEFIQPGMVEALLSEPYDYVIDAIDSFTPKLSFIRIALAKNIRMISSMGAGGKLDPTQLQVADISKSYQCPFAQQVRKTLKKEKIYRGFKVVFSPEKNIEESLFLTDGKNYKKSAYGTMSYMPATFGAVAAATVIRDLIDL